MVFLKNKTKNIRISRTGTEHIKKINCHVVIRTELNPRTNSKYQIHDVTS